jgi:hypothetical protein
VANFCQEKISAQCSLILKKMAQNRTFLGKKSPCSYTLLGKGGGGVLRFNISKIDDSAQLWKKTKKNFNLISIHKN